jgi:hypothetical protein
MQLNPGRFNAHLQKMGQTFLWRRAYACPCRTASSGAARQDCPRCSGKGQIWADPIKCVAGVAGQKTQVQWAQFGIFMNGDVVVSIPENSAMYEMGQFDRAVMENSSDRFSLQLTRGRDRLNGPVTTIDRVFWLNQANDIIEGGIPAISSEGQLTWTTGAPPPGQQYSVSGTRLSEYFCWGPLPSDRNMHHGARLPRGTSSIRFVQPLAASHRFAECLLRKRLHFFNHAFDNPQSWLCWDDPTALPFLHDAECDVATPALFAIRRWRSESVHAGVMILPFSVEFHAGG